MTDIASFPRDIFWGLDVIRGPLKIKNFNGVPPLTAINGRIAPLVVTLL